MSLAERLATPPAIKRNRSVMDAWIGSLSEEDQKTVMAAVLNKQWRHSDLNRALAAEGAPKIAETSFGHWRNRVIDESR